jgi:hypothetical protein
MIAIKFSSIYEDRVNLYLKATNLKEKGVTYNFYDTPSGQEEKLCYWMFDYRNAKQVNLILTNLIELKAIMGIHDLEFCYCNGLKEFYCQYSNDYGNIPWFKV